MPTPARNRSRTRARSPGRALSTDAWYTLIYITPGERARLAARRRRVWRRLLAAGGLSAPDAERRLLELRSWKERSEAGGRTPPVGEQARWLAARSRVEVDEEELADGLDRALLAARIALAPGAGRVLRTLERAGVPLAIVSNVANETGRAARTILDRTGTLPFFRVVYLSSDHRWSKPSPRPFTLVARYLGVSVADLVHVGDLAYDVDGVRRAGGVAVRFVGYRRWNGYLPGSQPPPGETAPQVRSWDELGRRWPRFV